MPVTIDTNFDFTNPAIKDFLIDEARKELALFDHTLGGDGGIIATAPADYTHDPDLDIRESASPETKAFNFLVEETFRVYQSQGVIGRVRATIHSRAELTIYADFLLFLRAGLSDAGREHARDLLEDYDVS